MGQRPLRLVTEEKRTGRARVVLIFALFFIVEENCEEKL